MTNDNPYDAPKVMPSAVTGSPAPLIWSVVTVFGSAMTGALLGLGVGAAIGRFAPNYYRSIFSNGGDPSFDPMAVGVGLGLTQGAGLGTLAGLILVALYYWYRTRTARIRNV